MRRINIQTFLHIFLQSQIVHNSGYMHLLEHYLNQVCLTVQIEILETKNGTVIGTTTTPKMDFLKYYNDIKVFFEEIGMPCVPTECP